MDAAASPSAPPPLAGPADGVSVFVHWKQQDLGLYHRRVDSTVAALLRHPVVQRVVAFTPPVDVVELRRLDASARREERMMADAIVRRWRGGSLGGRHVELTHLYGDGHDEVLGRVLPRRADYPAFVTDAAERLGGSRRLLWLYPHVDRATTVLEAAPWDVVVVDMVDDETAMAADDTRAREVLEGYAVCAQHADLIVFSTRNARRAFLRHGFGNVRAPLLHHPNAFDPRAAADALGPAMERHPTGGDTVIGYVGHLRERIDHELMARVAEHAAKRGWTFEIIGPGMPPALRERLEAHRGVRILGALPYGEAMARIRRHRAGVVPHERSRVTDAMHPLKVLQYAGLGIPVVATNVANVAPSSGERVRVVENDDFLDALDAALAQGPGERPTLPDAWDRYVDRCLRRVGLVGEGDRS